MFASSHAKCSEKIVGAAPELATCHEFAHEVVGKYNNLRFSLDGNSVLGSFSLLAGGQQGMNDCVGNEPEGDSLEGNHQLDGVCRGHSISHSLLRTSKIQDPMVSRFGCVNQDTNESAVR